MPVLLTGLLERVECDRGQTFLAKRGRRHAGHGAGGHRHEGQGRGRDEHRPERDARSAQKDPLRGGRQQRQHDGHSHRQ